MKNKLLASLFFLSTIPSFGQFDIDTDALIDKMFGPIESDRPGQCLSAKTAGWFAIQLQTGFQYGQSPGINSNILVPTQLRIGLLKKWEINTSFTYQRLDYNLVNTTASGFRSPDIGIRYAFLDGEGWKPSMALQASMSIPSSRGDYQQSNLGSSYYLITSNSFDVLSVNSTFGMVFPGNGASDPSFPWVLNFGFGLGDKWSTFVEGFGEFTNLTISADAGIAYTPISSLQLDLFGGMYNLDNNTESWFAELGVSYNFSFAKMYAKKKANEFKNMFKGE